MVCGLNKETELAWAQTQQKLRSPHEQTALLRDIEYSYENFGGFKNETNDPKPKYQNGYKN